MNGHYNHSTFLINRFDHYFDAVNNKGNFYLAFNTAVIGVMVALLTETVSLTVSTPWLLESALWGYLILSVASNFLTLMAINPFLRSGNTKNQYNSLIFFGSIAELDKDDFVNKYKGQSENDVSDDIIKQVYQLATGLNVKYKRLLFASYCILLEIIAFLPLVYLLT